MQSAVLYKVVLNSSDRVMSFLSTDQAFSLLKMDRPVPQEIVKAVINEIGEETLSRFSQNGFVGINAFRVQESSLSTVEWLIKEDVVRFVDVTYLMRTKRSDGSYRDLIKLGLYAQALGLAAALLTIITYPAFPFCWDCLLIDIVILLALTFPLFMQSSFKGLRKRVSQSFFDLNFKLSDNPEIVKQQLLDIQRNVKNSPYSFPVSLYKYIKKISAQ